MMFTSDSIQTTYNLFLSCFKSKYNIQDSYVLYECTEKIKNIFSIIDENFPFVQIPETRLKTYCSMIVNVFNVNIYLHSGNIIIIFEGSKTPKMRINIDLKNEKIIDYINNDSEEKIYIIKSDLICFDLIKDKIKYTELLIINKF